MLATPDWTPLADVARHLPLFENDAVPTFNETCALSDLGFMRLYARDFPGAMDCFTRALARDPKYLSPHAGLCLLHRAQGDDAALLAQATAAAALAAENKRPRGDWWRWKHDLDAFFRWQLVAWRALGRREDAIVAAQAMVERSAETWRFELAFLYLEAGDRAAAQVSACRPVLRHTGTHLSSAEELAAKQRRAALREFAELCSERGRSDDASYFSRIAEVV